LVYIPDNFSANLPALGEMLYAWALAGGSDRAPQLIHGVAGALCVGLTYTLGRRCAPRPLAALSAVGLAGTPLLPFLSTRAYIDLFTLLFALVAFTAFVAWLDSRRAAWLVVAGSACGLALATKYAAVSLVLVLGAGVAIAAWTAADSGFHRRVRAVVRDGLAFALSAGVAAAPWYARQIVLLGSPIWPMYVGGRDWDAQRVEQLTYFINQYGAGHRLVDWLALPVNVYVQSWRFGHVPDSYPPLLAVLAPVGVGSLTTPAAWLAGAAGALALFWVRGWQDLRFLLPVYPMLAVLGAVGAGRLLRRVAWQGAAVAGIAALLALVAAARELPAVGDAAGVVTGWEPVAAYLQRVLPDQRAIELLNAQAVPGSAALFLGDGQIWYCRQRCIPDAAHDNLLEWFARPGSATASLDRLRAARVSHILLSKRDYWYLEHQDPAGRLKEQLAQFYIFKAQYLDMIYDDDLTELYRGRW
jgi:4-amino-4-deoxy-L-arabinose transferase-like glycosyltransferase